MVRTIRKTGRVFLVAAIMLLVGGAALAKSPHNVVYVIGDSLSDPGNLYALTQGYPPSPPYAGRFSNGPVWTEYFAEEMSLAVDSRAYGGSFSGEQFFAGTVYTNFNNVQYMGLFPPLPGAGEQVDELIEDSPGGLNPTGLYIVWTGSNDFFLGLVDPANMPQILAQTVANVADTICELSAFGARHFLVGNIPDIGLSPLATSLGPQAGPFMSSVIAQYNDGLSQAIATLPPVCGESIQVFDSYRMLNDVYASPGAYGLTNVTEACLSDSGICPNPDEYLFWDDVHPTTATHEIFSGLIRQAFCGTGAAHPGLRSKPAGQPPEKWRGVCYGTK